MNLGPISWPRDAATPLPSNANYFGFDRQSPDTPPLAYTHCQSLPLLCRSELSFQLDTAARFGTFPIPTCATDISYARGSNATLLRAKVIQSRGELSPCHDFTQDLTLTLCLCSPMQNTSTSKPFDSVRRRIPILKFQSLQRLSNLVTTRSNVYAVWITVGYFEVEPVWALSIRADSLHQSSSTADGYTLGQELGVDTKVRWRGIAPFTSWTARYPSALFPVEDLNTEKNCLAPKIHRVAFNALKGHGPRPAQGRAKLRSWERRSEKAS